MSQPPNDPNPYRAPVHSGELDAPDEVADQELLRKFRSQTAALGVLWLAVGALSVGVGASLLRTNGQDIPAAWRGLWLLLVGFITTAGVLWFVLGFFACFKRLWAVKAGQTLGFVSLAVFVVSLNVCAILLLGVVLAQTQRVLKWGAALKKAQLLPN